MFLLQNVPKYYILDSILSNMVAQAAKTRGSKVKMRKQHTEMYKIINFQNSWKTFQVKLPNDCTKILGTRAFTSNHQANNLIFIKQNLGSSFLTKINIIKLSIIELIIF